MAYTLPIALLMQVGTAPPAWPTSQPAPGTVLAPASTWHCNIRDAQNKGSTFDIAFDKFVQAGARADNSNVTSDTSSRFAGVHGAQLVYGPHGNDPRMKIGVTVKKDKDHYYYLRFDYYGQGEKGVVTLEEEKHVGDSSVNSSAGIGYCSVSEPREMRAE